MDTDSVLTLLQDVAAQVITPRFRRLADAEVMEKNPGDLVTVADQEAEILITRRLRAEYPDALIVGEEATAADPSLLSALETAEHAFVVDPVDGTRNFVHGRREHAVMAAELRGGEAVRGWVWQPEFERAYVGEHGSGVLCNGEPITRPAPSPVVEEMRVLSSRPTDEGGAGRLTVGRSAWCCGVDYPWLLDGTADAVVYSSAKPWDHAPGSLFVREAGGVVRFADGTEYTPGRSHHGRLVPAASADVWEAIMREVGGLLRSATRRSRPTA